MSVHEVPPRPRALDEHEVAQLLDNMRTRYETLASSAQWGPAVDIAGHMAAGVMLCLGDLERLCSRQPLP